MLIVYNMYQQFLDYTNTYLYFFVLLNIFGDKFGSGR